MVEVGKVLGLVSLKMTDYRTLLQDLLMCCVFWLSWISDLTQHCPSSSPKHQMVEYFIEEWLFIPSCHFWSHCRGLAVWQGGVCCGSAAEGEVTWMVEGAAPGEAGEVSGPKRSNIVSSWHAAGAMPGKFTLYIEK